MIQYGDICKLNGTELPEVDVVTGGSPCFVAGTLITTKEGLVPIENIKKGDLVLTHTKNFKKVTDSKCTGNKLTYNLYGMSCDKITATENHPFYARKMSRVWNNSLRRYVRVFTSPEWISLNNLDKTYYLGYPVIDDISENPLNITDEEAYLIGRYVADGFLRLGQRADRSKSSKFYEVHYSIGLNKRDKFISKITTYHYYEIVNLDKNIDSIRIYNKKLTNLCLLCGRGALNKFIPKEILNLPKNKLEKFFEGYMDGDGCFTHNKYQITTVSKLLAFGLIQVIGKLYKRPCALYFQKRPSTQVIEGRVVSQHDTYQIKFTKDIRKQDHAFYQNGFIWFPIRKIEKATIEKVYNLSVEDDESYCANNICVHNCQDLSVAGARAGLDGERSGLFMEQVRVIKEMRKHDQEVNGHTGEDIRPRYMVWENVCVTGDTLVTTSKGLKEIKDIEESEYVKTLSGKYMPVLKKHITENQDVVKVHFSGGEDLIVTPNHPFYARKKVDKIKKGKKITTYTDPEWIPAIELTNKHMLASVLDVPTMDVKLDADTLWLVGRYIALGSVSTNRSNPRIYLSYGRCGFEETKEILSKTAYKFYENKSYKSSRYTFTSADFYFYIKNAGSGVGNKRVPSYVFELPLPLQKCVLDGFLSSNKDFSEGKPTITITTASRFLAHSLVQLIKNVYETSANIVVIDKDKLNSQDKVIQGHKITHNHSSYKIMFSLSNKKSDFVEDDLLWIPVKKVENLENKETVYNLSVSEDNTYVANGIIVHNCGAFSSNGGEDFRVVLEETAKIADESATIPRLKEKERWTTAGSILGEGYSLAWRVHDAQYWGVPQRRKRICLLADFNGDTAGKLLFDLECKRKTDDPESNKID